MSRFGEPCEGELYPSHSDQVSAATKKGNNLQDLPYTIYRPSGVRPEDFVEFSEAISTAVPQAIIVLPDNDSMQMTWKDGNPAELLRFGDLPEAPTGTIHAVAVWGPCYWGEEQELTSLVLGFPGSRTQLYEDVDGRKDNDSKMLFLPLEPSDTRRKATRHPGSIDTKFGKGWRISTYNPKADIDAASSKAPGTSSGQSTCTADGGQEERGTVVAED